MRGDYRQLSYWHDSVGGPIEPRAALPGDVAVDVAIVGGGFTGLWTAYYLRRADPTLRVAVIEKETAGYGASGRNGGWCVGELAAHLPVLEKRAGRDQAIAMTRAVHATVDEVGAVTAAEGIDCHFAKGGVATIARSAVEVARLESLLKLRRSYGFTDDDYWFAGPREASAVLNVAGLHGALFSAHGAALHPARLARGIADAAERAGAAIYEGTAARSIDGGRVVTDAGTVTADVVVRATEAYTVGIDGHANDLIPLGNYVVATEPLADSVMDEIGMKTRPTFADARHVFGYGQRTVDGRLVWGGLSVPYRLGSKIEPDPVSVNRVHHKLERSLRALFPAIGDAAITHRWGGVLGVPRDFFPSVGLDRDRKYAWAGGYVGEGVAASNLAGRTLADLITGAETDLAKLPWVNHQSPPWEGEPLRWLGVKGAGRMFAIVDAIERATGRRQRWADRLL